MNYYNKEYGVLSITPPTGKNAKGQFLKGHTPHNKGKHPREYMSEEGYQKMIKALDNKRTGNPNFGGCNKRSVIMIKNGKICGVFESSEDASRKTGIMASNIRSVCRGARKRAGGYQWFWEESEDWINLIEE